MKRERGNMNCEVVQVHKRLKHVRVMWGRVRLLVCVRWIVFYWNELAFTGEIDMYHDNMEVC